MIDVHYFANIRETLGMAHEQIPAASLTTVSSLMALLVQKHGERWASVFAGAHSARVLVAVNHEVVPASTAIKDGDEVAFFPPVTGG
jgi:molybdopterin synthase sulfur carrier subunit